MSTLRHFLAAREAEIREQIKLLRAELTELKRAKAAIENPEGLPDETAEGEVRDSTRVTIKDMVRTVFGRPEAAKGLVAGEVLEAIERSFNVKMERTSLSPQLSRLRESGDVVLQDGRWFPSEPRLSQAVAIPNPRMMHHGGGNMVTAASMAQDAARISRATIATHSAAEEAMKIARASMLPRDIVAASKLASDTHSSISAIEAALRSAALGSAATSAAQGSASHTMKAIEEADRKMRSLLHGHDHHDATKNWGSGPKTE